MIKGDKFERFDVKYEEIVKRGFVIASIFDIAC